MADVCSSLACAPGSAQTNTGCCKTVESGGGNCEWYCGDDVMPNGKQCGTKNNPNKCCKVCDPVETTCTKYTLTQYECVPSCVTQNPQAPTLISPNNGVNVGGTGVALSWSGIADWGVACSTNNQYQVIVDTASNPTTVYSTVDEGVTTDYFVGTVGQTYYWKIRAHNGSVYTDSAVRSFTFVDNQITGTIYIDADGSCSQGTPGNLGGALSLEWANDTVAVNSNGTYTLTATSTGSDTLTLTGIPAGYICSPSCGSGTCSISGVDPAVNGTGHNFFVTQSRGAWFQLEGAGVFDHML